MSLLNLLLPLASHTCHFRDIALPEIPGGLDFFMNEAAAAPAPAPAPIIEPHMCDSMFADEQAMSMSATVVPVLTASYVEGLMATGGQEKSAANTDGIVNDKPGRTRRRPTLGEQRGPSTLVAGDVGKLGGVQQCRTLQCRYGIVLWRAASTAGGS